MTGPTRASGLVRAISIGIGVLLAVGLPIAMLASSVTGGFFDAQLVTEVLSEHLIQPGDLRQLLAQELLRPDSAPDQEDEISFQSWLVYLEAEDRSAIAQILFPDPWINDQLDDNLDRLYIWLDGEQPEPDFQIDLRPVKQRFLAGGSLQLAEIIVASWPICTDSELVYLLEAAIGSGDQEFIACQPPSPLRTVMVELLVEGLVSEALQTPDQVGLGELFGDQDAQETALELKRGISRLKTLATAAWLLPASGLGIILALGVRSWRQMPLWWGLPLLATGLIGVLIALLVASALPDWISGIGQAAGPNPLMDPLKSALRDLL